MSGTPRPWQRPRLGTPLGRARLRQPFRSPLLTSQAAGTPSSAGTRASTGTPSSAGTRAAAGTPSSAGTRAAAGLRATQPFRSPLLTSEQDVLPALACDQELTPTPTDPRGSLRQNGSPAGTSPQAAAQPAGSAASPVLRASTAVSLPTGSEPTTPSHPADSDGPPVEPGPGGAGQRPPETADPAEQPDCGLAAALAAADEELSRLESAGCRAEQLPLYIAALHGYNEVKDAAQLVMGRIAELDGVTVRAVHQRYDGLPPAEQS